MTYKFEEKIIFNKNYLADNNVSNVYKFNLDIIDNQCGIYIFISRGLKKAYVGRAKDISIRLQTHIKCAFSDDKINETNAYKILIEDDAEMYCCFLGDTYNYDEVNDFIYELSNLEGLTMESVKNSGFELVNRNLVSYNINNLTDINYFKNNTGIILTHNLFSNGLKNFIRVKTTSENFLEDTSNNQDIDFLNYKIEYLKYKLKDEEYERRSAKAKINSFRLENLNYSFANETLTKRINEYKNENYNLQNSLNSYRNDVYRSKNKSKKIFEYIIKKINFYHEYKEFKFLDNTKFNEFAKKFKETVHYNNYKKISNILTDNPEYFSLKLDYANTVLNKNILNYTAIRTSALITYLDKYNRETCSKKKDEIVNECSVIIYKLLHDLIIHLGGEIPEDILNSDT